MESKKSPAVLIFEEALKLYGCGACEEKSLGTRWRTLRLTVPCKAHRAIYDLILAHVDETEPQS